VDFDGLASLHVLELRLLEVSRDPQILKRDQGEQILAGGQVSDLLQHSCGVMIAVSRSDDLA